MSRHIATIPAALAAALVAAAAGASTPPGQAPPANLTPPAISGSATVGATLSASSGSWSGKSLSFAYQWLRCDTSGGSCASIGGATSPTYAVPSSLADWTLRVVVTATNKNGSAVATSNATGTVVGPQTAPPPPPPPLPAPPAMTSPPTVSGTPQQGQTLTAAPGTWSGSTPMTYSYQWQRCDSAGSSCSAVSGATANTYLLASADAGHTMRVSVTATNSAGSATASSAATAAVATATSVSNLFTGDFETDNFAQWDHVSDPNTSSAHPPKVVASPHVQGGFSANLTVDPTDTYTTGSGATSTRVDVYENARTDLASEGKDVWQHTYVMFPSSATSSTPYRPTPGNWNWLVQWHSASSIIGGISTTGGEPVELGVQTGVSFTDSGCGYSSSGDVSKQELFGYFAGGDVASGPVPRRTWCLNKPLQYDHWYDLYFHIIWSKSSSIGLFHLEVDGAVVADLHQATLLYNSSTGATDVPNVEISNYRGPDPATGLAPTWSSAVFYDGVLLGPTKSSVQ